MQKMQKASFHTRQYLQAWGYYYHALPIVPQSVPYIITPPVEFPQGGQPWVLRRAQGLEEQYVPLPDFLKGN